LPKALHPFVPPFNQRYTAMSRRSARLLGAFSIVLAGTVLYGHVREIEVEEGETVRPGEVVAKVGNNGNSRNPHIHIGAWEDDASKLGAKEGTPLQIQVDLYVEERLGEELDSE